MTIHFPILHKGVSQSGCKEEGRNRSSNTEISSIRCSTSSDCVRPTVLSRTSDITFSRESDTANDVLQLVLAGSSYGLAKLSTASTFFEIEKAG